MRLSCLATTSTLSPAHARSSRTCATSRTRTSGSSLTASTCPTKAQSSPIEDRPLGACSGAGRLWAAGPACHHKRRGPLGALVGSSGLCWAGSGCWPHLLAVCPRRMGDAASARCVCTAPGVCGVRAHGGTRARTERCSLRSGWGEARRATPPAIWMGEGLVGVSYPSLLGGSGSFATTEAEDMPLRLARSAAFCFQAMRYGARA
mmetsp:Transcript_20790/g.67324  ORF Transcript_20790/g.67324 Transcript_20790/m.67324 type:complete len:205 (+) Transcript_20790:467-1081(+)